MISQITEELEIIPKKEQLKIFQKYLERMQLCIKNRGDYFEHLIKMMFYCLIFFIICIYHYYWCHLSKLNFL